MCRSETVRSIQIRLYTSLGIVGIVVLEWKWGWFLLNTAQGGYVDRIIWKWLCISGISHLSRKQTLFAEPASTNKSVIKNQQVYQLTPFLLSHQELDWFCKSHVAFGSSRCFRTTIILKKGSFRVVGLNWCILSNVLNPLAGNMPLSGMYAMGYLIILYNILYI